LQPFDAEIEFLCLRTVDDDDGVDDGTKNLDAGTLILTLNLMLGLQGMNKPWEAHQLATFRPEHSIYETKSKMSDVSSGVYATNASQGRVGSVPDGPRRRIEPNRHMARASEDEDSVFDDGKICLFLNIIVITPSHHMGGATWLSGQRGALAS
jgi:hypothetical protein